MHRSRLNTRRSAPKKRSETENTKTRRGIGTGAETESTSTAADETDHIQGLMTMMIMTGENVDPANMIAMRRTTGTAIAGDQSHDQGRGPRTVRTTVITSEGARARHVEEKTVKIERATGVEIAHHHDAHTTSLALKRIVQLDYAYLRPQLSRNRAKVQPTVSPRCKLLLHLLKNSVPSAYDNKKSKMQRRKRSSRRTRTEDVALSLVFAGRPQTWIWAKRLLAVDRITALKLMFDGILALLTRAITEELVHPVMGLF
jgi:hypothetical protein